MRIVKIVPSASRLRLGRANAAMLLTAANAHRVTPIRPRRICIQICYQDMTASAPTRPGTHSHIANVSSAEQYTARAASCDRATEERV